MSYLFLLSFLLLLIYLISWFKLFWFNFFWIICTYCLINIPLFQYFLLLHFMYKPINWNLFILLLLLSLSLSSYIIKPPKVSSDLKHKKSIVAIPEFISCIIPIFSIIFLLARVKSYKWTSLSLYFSFGLSNIELSIFINEILFKFWLISIIAISLSK